MDDSEVRRKYLEEELARLGLEWKYVSIEVLGRSHSYIQQHIKYGTPRFLREEDRNALVKEYGLDGERLKPPPPKPRNLAPVPLFPGREPEVSQDVREQREREDLLLVWGSSPATSKTRP